MMSVQHFPVIAVMLQFLAAFMVVIFGLKNRSIRIGISLIAYFITFALTAAMIPHVMLEGNVISYWMGNWEPVAGYAIGIGYEVDALGLFFGLLVTGTSLLAAIYSLRYLDKDRDLGYYYVLNLLLTGSVLGLVLTGDLFNMFVMIEIMTFASVGLTAYRSWKAESLEAGFKYLITGSVGSSFILLGTTLIYGQCHTLNLAQVAAQLANGITPTTMMALGLILAGYGVKSYIFPFHAPAADAYGVAPTSVSMIFSGMVNKAGVYGIIRMSWLIFSVMDTEAIQIMLTVIGVLTMFVGVTMALAQHDFKRLLAFHSISQIGYVIMAAGLGTALGLTGSLFHAMNHTLFKGLLFLCAGAVLYSVGTTDLDKLGGLSKKMPKTTICFLIGAFAISGLPPFNGFASKWMMYQAAYTKALETGNFFYAVVTIAAVVVSVMTLASFIKVTQAVFFGQTPSVCEDAKEVPFSMRLPMWIMAVLCVVTGIFYPVVEKTLLAPAVSAASGLTTYVDKMMGEGYAAAAGVTESALPGFTFSYWDPVLWLVLFVVVFFAVGFVIVTGKGSRGRVSQGADGSVDAKYDTFFSGEKSLHSHVGGSDLFWGFKHEWKGYFRVMQSAHSGVVNDYTIWTVVAAAVILAVVFIFVH